MIYIIARGDGGWGYVKNWTMIMGGVVPYGLVGRMWLFALVITTVGNYENKVNNSEGGMMKRRRGCYQIMENHWLL